MKFLNRILVRSALGAFLITGSVASASAGPVSVSARLDSVSILMGNVTSLNLEVVQDEGVRGEFPLLRLASGKGRATLVGDTIEIGAPVKTDTTKLGSGRIQINMQVPVQAFDSGTYVLPPVWFVAGRDSAATQPLNLRVVPVKALATDSISPLAGVVPGHGSSVLDNVPDFIYYYWWTVVLLAAVVLAAWWFIRRRKKNKPLIPKAPVKVLSPREEAIEALQRLKARKLWEQGMEKEYFTELTDILRRYLVRRFGINAMEMTSREIIQALGESEGKPSREFVRRVLDMADFVKFAKVRPLPADNVSAYNDVYDFVIATASENKPETESAANETTSKKSKETKDIKTKERKEGDR